MSKHERRDAPLTAAVPSVTFGDISPHRGESPSERGDDVCEGQGGNAAAIKAERRRWREERRRVSEQTRAPRRAPSERGDDVCEGQGGNAAANWFKSFSRNQIFVATNPVLGIMN